MRHFYDGKNFRDLIITTSLDSHVKVVDFKRKDRVISVRLVQNKSPQISVDTSRNSPYIKSVIYLDAHLISSGSDINFYDNNNTIN